VEKRKIWHWGVVALLSLIWGSSYILMKRGLESFSAYQVGSLRILITFICLLPIAIKNLPKLNRTNILSVIMIGLFGSGIPAFLFPIAETKISSSLAGLLNSLSPVFTLIIGVAFYYRKTMKTQIAGVFLGLVGAVGLLYSDSFTFNHYGLFVVLATILSGISTNEVTKVKELNGLQLTSLSFFVISPIALIYLPLSDFHTSLATENSLRNLGFIAILAIGGSVIALSLFYLLINDTNPVFASMTSYFIPIVSTLWGIADNEKFTVSMIISTIFIFSGVYIISRPAFLMKMIRNKTNE
jgi:drug/metabolite transporter (DMT)-like permease